MERKENIISIRNRNVIEANEAFADFMLKTEKCFNERSIANPRLYKGISSDELEVITENILKEIAPSTPFRPEEIKLVAGHSFPDIMTEKYFGVEVKSTKDNKWTSTGSSIVETTRDKNVENIYMLFGKLGGTPPAFRCRPYQDCLINIAVTHSPRYLIDMEIKDRSDKTIFDKLQIKYEDFSKRQDKIDIVRNYYIRNAREENKEEMPWWVGKNTIESEENSIIPPIRLMNNCTSTEIMMLKAQMVVLFPRVINSDYAEAALWLCTHRYLLSLNLRDLFSAGGQWKVINNTKLKTPYPAVLGKLMEIMPYVHNYLSNETNLEYGEFNIELEESNNKLETWLNQVESIFEKYTYKVGSEWINFSDLDIDLHDYLLHPEKYVLSH